MRGLLARLAQVFLAGSVKRAFVLTLRVSCFCCCIFYCDQPGAGYHVPFLV